MRFQQHLGIASAICSSLLVSYGAYAQTANPTPGGTNPADMERICAEYMNANGNSELMQNNRTGSTTGNTATGTTGTTTNRNTTNRSGNTATGTTGTTTNRNTTNRSGNTATGTTGTTTSGNTTNRSGNTASGTTGTTTSREATNRTGGTTGNTATGTSGTSTATRQGVGSFTAEELDRMCANFINNSESDRPTPSTTPSGSTRPTQPRTAPTNR